MPVTLGGVGVGVAMWMVFGRMGVEVGVPTMATGFVEMEPPGRMDHPCAEGNQHEADCEFHPLVNAAGNPDIAPREQATDN